MFSINDIVVYGNSGVCRIIDISIPPFAARDNQQLYYTLEPVDSACVIYAPISTSVFMRHIISAQEVDNLIDAIPSIHAEAHHDTSLQQLTRYYESILSSHNCADLIALIMSIYTKKQYLEKNKRKFGQIDEKFMKRAEDLLYSEFSIALHIAKDKVKDYIKTRVRKASVEPVS